MASSGRPRTRGRPANKRSHGGAGGRASFPWINSQIIAASEAGSVDNLLKTVATHLPQMNLVNLSTSLHRLAKMSANDMGDQARCRTHPVLEDLLRALCASFHGLRAGDAQPQSLSNVAWSLATLRLLNRALLQEVATLSVGDMAAFKPFELSTMLWAFAKLGGMESGSNWGSKGVFQAAAPHIVKNMQHFGFRCLATTVWAFATAKQRHARLFRAVAAQMLPMAHAANCQEMANTAWAFGTADFHDAQLFHELAKQAMTRLDDFKPQELSNILWGLATNSFFHEAFFSAASLSAQTMNLQAQHLANIIWAYARVRPKHAVTHATILALLPWCTSQLDSFKPQEVSSTALAVAKAFGQCDEDGNTPSAATLVAPRGSVPPQVRDFFLATIPWAIPRLSEFSAQSLANTVSAFSMLPMGSEAALFAALSNEVLSRYDDLEPRSLLHLLKGFSAAPPSQGGVGNVVRVVAAGVARRIGELSPQDCHTLARVCCSVLRIPVTKDTNAEELRSMCLALAVGDGQVQKPRALPRLEEDPHLPPHPCAPPVSPWALGGGLIDSRDTTDITSPAVPAGAPFLEGFSLPPPPPPRASSFLSVPPSEGLDAALTCGPTGQLDGLLDRLNEESMSAANVDGALRPGWPMRSPMPFDSEALGLRALQHPHAVGLPASFPGLEGGEHAAAQSAWDTAAEMKPGGPTALCSISESQQVSPEDPHISLACVQDMPPIPPALLPAPRFLSPASPPPPFIDQEPSDVPYFHFQQQMAKRGYTHSEYQWRFSVKNSFLHVRYNDRNDSDDDQDSQSGASQRSNSVPSRLDHDDIMEDWNRRRQNSTVEPRDADAASPVTPNQRVIIAPLEARTVAATRTVMRARGPLTALEAPSDTHEAHTEEHSL